jgi:uncharacterized protein (TIGR02171 family)
MKKVLSSGKSFSQGWNSAQSGSDERPGMESGFTYDYWLDSTEVTQGQYYAVTGRRPVPAGSQYGDGDEYPVYRVSWFDAVLFCNARSRHEHLDTVYSYSGIKALSDGRVYELTGLLYDVSRNGYRLPTESEWEYAARGGSSDLPFSEAADSLYACYYAWYGENSSSKTHPVGTRLPNLLGLYDIAGNVFEWTNDWKCIYNGKRLANSLGALQPNNEYEKVIKGGSYNYPLAYLRPSHRSATYATMLSSANEYVGFRCARGIIPKGRYIGTIQQDFTPNPVTIMTSGSDLWSFLGTQEAKLVFVNVTGTNRTLCFVDFSRTFSYIREYLDDRKVYMPVISPDGRYVAYCSNNEGQCGPSKISIRGLDSLNTEIVQLAADTAYIPRWWINPSTGDKCIVYSNSAVDNDNPMWNGTKTFLQKMSGGKPEGLPQEFIGEGSYHDGISVNGQYAVTGYRRLMVKDMWANTSGKQLFLSPQNGKDLTGSCQVCNVSVSPDMGSEVRCMFLDFGYPRTSGITGCGYGEHEYLFVSDMAGVISNFVRCPTGEQSWDGIEWSNQPRFGVGCGWNSAEQSHAVYAINLESRTWKQLITGTIVQQPYLRTGNPDTYLDSWLGQYNDPPTDDRQAHLATKMLTYWQIFDALEVAIIGSSQAHYGLDPSRISGLMAFNLAAPGGDLIGQKNIILHYLLPHSTRLKIVCSSLDIGWLRFPSGNVNWESGIGKSRGFKYDSCHNFWVQSTDSIRNLFRSVPLPIPADTLFLGFSGFPSLGWGNNPPDMPSDDCLLLSVENNVNYQQNFAAIRMIADGLRTRRIHWIIVNFPENPNYKNTRAYSFQGPSRQTAHDILDTLYGMTLSNSYFHLYDANNDGNHDYDSSDALDAGHLSAQGAGKLSVRVDSIIHSILP